jgi:hypothetical protein
MKKIITFVSFLTLIVIISSAYIFNIEKSDKNFDWYAASKVCSKNMETIITNSDSQTIKCIQDIIIKSLNDNIKESSTALTLVASEDYIFYGHCHLAMHLLGSRLLAHFGSIENAISHLNYIDCGNGLSHGVLDQWATKKSLNEKDFKGAILSCEAAEKVSNGGCAEGIGHAAYQSSDTLVFEDRVKKALSICYNFIDTSAGWHCAYGVMMQPFFKQNPDLIDESALEIPDGKQIIKLCDLYSKEKDYVYLGCISVSGWLMGLKENIKANKIQDPSLASEFIASSKFIANLEKNIGYCSEVTNKEAGTGCLSQLFSRLPLNWYQNDEKFIDRCEQLSDEKNIIELCISGGYEFIAPDKFISYLIKYKSMYNVWSLVEERWERERGDKTQFDSKLLSEL